jgi:hypothetical protein
MVPVVSMIWIICPDGILDVTNIPDMDIRPTGNKVKKQKDFVKVSLKYQLLGRRSNRTRLLPCRR